MANFDFQSFTSAFLNTIGQGIKERTDNIDKYTDILDEEYKDAKTIFKNRRSVVENSMSLVGKAKSLGANDQQIKAAVSSGKSGLADFVKGLAKYSSAKGGGTLSFSEVDTLIEGEELFEEGDVREFLERSYGLMQDEEDKTQYKDERSGLQKIFAVDPRGSAKAMFGTDKMSMIELARQDAYDSLAPDRASVFLTLDQATSNIYDPIDTNQDFIKEYEAAEKLIKSSKVYKTSLGEDEQKDLVRDAQLQVMERYVALYGQKFIDGLPRNVIPDELMTLAQTSSGADTTKGKLASAVVEAAASDLGTTFTEQSGNKTVKYTVNANGELIGNIKIISSNGASKDVDKGRIDELKEMGFKIEGMFPVVSTAEAAIDSMPTEDDPLFGPNMAVTMEEIQPDKMPSQETSQRVKESVEKTIKQLKEEHEAAETAEEKEALVPKIRETVQSAQSVGIFESDEFKYLKNLVSGFFADRRSNLAETMKKVEDQKTKEEPSEEISVQAVERFGGQAFSITPDQKVYINDRRTGKPKTLITDTAITGPLLEQASKRTDGQIRGFFEYARDQGFISDKDRVLTEWKRYADKNLISDFVRNQVISDIQEQFQ